VSAHLVAAHAGLSWMKRQEDSEHPLEAAAATAMASHTCSGIPSLLTRKPAACPFGWLVQVAWSYCQSAEGQLRQEMKSLSSAARTCPSA